MMRPALTDEDVWAIYPHLRSEKARADIRDQLRMRARMKILRLLPSPTGTCAKGHRVTLDDKGAMSSGYPYHVTNGSPCSDGGIVWHPDTPYQARLKALLAELRDGVR